jgi:hypothetical protein
VQHKTLNSVKLLQVFVSEWKPWRKMFILLFLNAVAHNPRELEAVYTYIEQSLLNKHVLSNSPPLFSLRRPHSLQKDKTVQHTYGGVGGRVCIAPTHSLPRD